MPTTREEREAILLQKRGLDPTKWTISDNGFLSQRQVAAPVAPPEPPREIGPFETAGRALVGAIPETVGGAIGGGLGVMGGTAAPVAGPATPFLGGLAGGIGGSMAAGALENEFAPQAYKDFVSAGREQNPLAAEVGTALPQLLMSNPLRSLKLARDLLRATPTLTRFTGAQLGQLGNLGVGAGMGAGSAVAEDAMGEGVGADTIPKALIRGGAGLLGAEPNALGRGLSLGTWKQSPETPDNWKGAAPVARDAMQKSARMETVDGTPVGSKPPIDADVVSSDIPGAMQVGSQSATDAAFAQTAPPQLGTGQAQIEAPPAGPKQLPEKTQPQEQGTQLGDTSDEWDKLISDISARTYKTDAETGVPNLRSSTGQRVAGLAQLPTDLERGLVKISTDAGIDTGPHELLHVILNDVLGRGTPGEKRFAQKVIAAGGGEEALVQGGGQEFTRRLIDEAGGQNPSLLKDLASFVKARFGAANKKDLERLAANTLRRGAGSEQYRPNAPTSAPKVPPVQPTEGENRSKKPNERTQALSESPVPESNDTIQKQLELTADPQSTKAVTLLVPGSGDVAVGDGLQRVKVPQGEAVYNPAKISEADVVKGGAGEQYDGRLLGMSQSVKPAAGDQVVTATKDGVGDVVTEAVAPGNEQAAIQSVEAAVPGGEVEVKPAAEIVNERTQPIGAKEYYNPDEKIPRRLDPFMPSIRRLAKSSDPRRQMAADVFRRLYSTRDMIRGKYANMLLRPLADAKGDAGDIAYRAMLERNATGTPPGPMPTREAQALYDTFDSTYRQTRLDANAAGQKVGGRLGKIDPTGMFNIIDPDTLKLLTTLDQNSPTWIAMRDDFIRLQTDRGFTQTKAFDAFKRYLNDMSSELNAGKAVDFGAVSLPEGMKLPPGWIDPSPTRATRRFIDRWARARAWHDIVEKDPTVKALFEGDNALSRDPDVVDAFEGYLEKPGTGRIPSLDTVGRLVNAIRLGPITRSIDAASTPIKMMSYSPISNWPAMLAELKNFNKHYEDTFKTSFNKPGGDIIMSDVLGAHQATANFLDEKITKNIVKFQGLELLETLGRTGAQAMGNQIGGVMRSMARAGDKRALRFLNELGTDWQTISPEELGMRIGRLAQGYYDPRDMPSWQKNSGLAPMFSLARWGTAQWNNFRQYAVEPALDGDPIPLIRWLFAGTVVGTLTIGQLRELFNNKKPYIAEIEEIRNAPKGSRAWQEAILKLATGSQAISTFGFVGDMVLMGMRSVTGKFAGGINSPSIDFAEDVAARSIKAVQAVAEGVPIADVARQYATDIAKQNVQFLQLVNRFSDETEDANKVRDFRMYRRLSGKNDPLPSANVDYSRADEKAFDKEKDPAAAERRAAGLAERARERRGTNTVEAIKDLRRAGQSRINFAPADYTERKAYFEYIERTQGKEAAAELEKAYQKALDMQRFKKSLPVRKFYERQL